MTKYIDRYYLNGKMYGIKFCESPYPAWREGWEEDRWLIDRWDGFGPVTLATDSMAYTMKPIWPITNSTLDVNTTRYVDSPWMWWWLSIILAPMASFENQANPLNGKDRITLWQIPLYRWDPYAWIGGDIWDATREVQIRWTQGANDLQATTYLPTAATGNFTLDVSFDTSWYILTIEITHPIDGSHTWTQDFSQLTGDDLTCLQNLIANNDLALILNCGRWYWDASMHNRLKTFSYTITPNV